jgi:hypothetical protein
MLEAVLNLVCLALPDVVAEGLLSGLQRLFDKRWERIASGSRARAEDAVRLLHRHKVSAWVNPVRGHRYDVVVRTRQAEVARALLHAPSSGRE